MYDLDFATENARQHRADFVRDAQLHATRRRNRRKEAAARAQRSSFAWVTVRNWHLSH